MIHKKIKKLSQQKSSDHFEKTNSVFFNPTKLLSLLLAFTLFSISLFAIPVKSESVNAENIHVAKDETIYVSLNSNGTISSIVAVNLLKDGTKTDKGDFVDYASYTDSKITTLTAKTDANISNDHISFTSKEDISQVYYRGVPKTQELPFNFDIKYFLGEDEIAGKDLLGKKGKISILLDVSTNENSHQYFADNFMCQIQLPLSLSIFSQISAPGAQSLVAGSTATYSFMVMPGQSKELRIDAMADGFEIDSASIACIPFDISEFIGGDIEFNEEDLEKLLSASDELASGAKDLNKGLNAIDKALGTLATSGKDLSSGQSSIYKGFSEFVDGFSQLAGGFSQFSDGFALAAGGGPALNQGFAELNAGVAGVFDSLVPLINSLPEQALPAEERAILLGTMEGLKAGLNGFGTSLQEYTDGINELSQNAAGIGQGLNTSLAGAKELKSGIGKSNSGMSEFSNGLTKLHKNFGSVKSGSKEIADGQKEFADGLKSSIGLFDEFTAEPYEGLPISFVNNDVTVDSVQIVISTNSIMMATVDPEAPEEDLAKGFWKKFIELFTGLFNKD